jgi:ATP-dependent Clp protease adaptor protein ClpS
MTETLTRTETRTDERTETKQPWLWNVVLLDDDDHTYEYVIRMLNSVFAMPIEKAFKAAEMVDAQGRVILLTTHKEHAELKRDQVHGFGRDVLISSCAGSMTAVLEPAECDAEDEDD